MNYIWLVSLLVLSYFIYKVVHNDNRDSYRKMLGAYVLWAFVNLVMLLIENGGSRFWPFSGFSKTYQYDISEFVVYVLGPVVYNFARNLMRTSRQ